MAGLDAVPLCTTPTPPPSSAAWPLGAAAQAAALHSKPRGVAQATPHTDRAAGSSSSRLTRPSTSCTTDRPRWQLAPSRTLSLLGKSPLRPALAPPSQHAQLARPQALASPTAVPGASPTAAAEDCEVARRVRGQTKAMFRSRPHTRRARQTCAICWTGAHYHPAESARQT